jgi:coenzyme F420-reducing hydrogenase delta subunit
MVLYAIRCGADGVWISGCHPGECHYIEANYYARRKFVLLRELLEYTGLGPGRVHFSWISSAEGSKFADVARQVIADIRALGPAEKLNRFKTFGGQRAGSN